MVMLLQDEVVQAAEVGAARKVFDLSLTELGPYSLDFTRSGRFLALAGRKGHLAVMDWQRGKLVTEIQASSPFLTHQRRHDLLSAFPGATDNHQCTPAWKDAQSWPSDLATVGHW